MDDALKKKMLLESRLREKSAARAEAGSRDVRALIDCREVVRAAEAGEIWSVSLQENKSLNKVALMRSHCDVEKICL